MKKLIAALALTLAVPFAAFAQGAAPAKAPEAKPAEPPKAEKPAAAPAEPKKEEAKKAEPKKEEAKAPAGEKKDATKKTTTHKKGTGEAKPAGEAKKDEGKKEALLRFDGKRLGASRGVFLFGSESTDDLQTAPLRRRGRQHRHAGLALASEDEVEDGAAGERGHAQPAEDVHVAVRGAPGVVLALVPRAPVGEIGQLVGERFRSQAEVHAGRDEGHARARGDGAGDAVRRPGPLRGDVRRGRWRRRDGRGLGRRPGRLRRRRRLGGRRLGRLALEDFDEPLGVRGAFSVGLGLDVLAVVLERLAFVARRAGGFSPAAVRRPPGEKEVRVPPQAVA